MYVYVYELVYRITTARKKDRQIFTQEYNTKTSYIRTTSPYVVVTTSSYDVVTTTSSRRGRHQLYMYDVVVRRRHDVVTTSSYDDILTTT